MNIQDANLRATVTLAYILLTRPERRTLYLLTYGISSELAFGDRRN